MGCIDVAYIIQNALNGVHHQQSLEGGGNVFLAAVYCNCRGKFWRAKISWAKFSWVRAPQTVSFKKL